MKINKPRIKPKGAHNIHGYLTAEAVTLEENLLPLNISDNAEPLEVYLSLPFSSLVMKLFALRDRLEDEEKDYGAYHAFDIYRIIAMMTEQEWEESLDLYEKYKEEPKIREAAEITETLFGTTESVGVLRVRQHARIAGFQISSENLDNLIEDLREIFGSK